MKISISIYLARFNIIFTLVCLASLVGFALFVPSFSSTNLSGVSDLFLFSMVWSYILLTPLFAVIALLMGNRRNKAVRANYGILLVWVLFAAWATTITF